VKPTIVTIGVYGFTDESFFRALQIARVDTFCDLRDRRSIRGSTYMFANSKRLQQRLQALSIRYLHMKNLAPSASIRALQQQADQKQREQKRSREKLSTNFIEIYQQMYLSAFDANQFLQQCGDDVHVLALFCVEREPAACHRSLIAERLEHDLQLSVTHLFP
jgi:predicted RNA-binding protein with EMAP domain